MSNAIRAFFSGKRNRFVDATFNLDLTYISDRIIAMGYPSTRFESLYRNDISDVAKFLHSKHGDRYLVINLSDRTYDPSPFGGRVVNAGFPDHHSPPLGLMWSLYSIIDFWLAVDKENVIAVHCLAGKGRTGMTIICTLIMQGFFNHIMRKSFSSVINAAINYFHDKRGDGVENPDQIRFIYQFLQSMNTMGSDMLMQIGEETQPAVFLPSLILYNVPVGEGGFLLPRLKIYLKKNNGWHIVFSSLWTQPRAPPITRLQRALVLPIGAVFAGDLLFVFLSQDEPLFHFSLSTLLLPRRSLASPSSVYLNHRCVSFEKEVSIPFTASFAAQLLCLHPRAFVLSSLLTPSKHATAADLATLAALAAQEEARRRAQPLVSFPSCASLVSTASVASAASAEDHPLLWRGAQEPAPSRAAGLLAECPHLSLLPRRPADSSSQGSQGSQGSHESHESHESCEPRGSHESHESHESQESLHLALSSNGGKAKALARPPTRHHRSFSDPFAQALSTMSGLSLAYETDSLKEGEPLSFSLPPDAKAPVPTRYLTEEEKEELGKEDPLFVDVEPVDKIVSISGIVDASEDVSSEVVTSPFPRLHPDSDVACAIPVLAKLTAAVNVGRSWKNRLLIITPRFVRVMRTLESDEVKTEVGLGENARAVLRAAGAECEVQLSSADGQPSQAARVTVRLTVRLACFEDAQRLALTLRAACGEAIPPCPGSGAHTAEKVRWLLYLLCPERVGEAEALTRANKPRLRAWLRETFGAPMEWMEAASDDLWESQDCEVVTEEGVVPVAQFLRGEERACHEISSSSRAIVAQLQSLLPREVFNRLVQVAAIRYPSPIPVIRAIVMKQNKDWGALFDQDPTGFVMYLKQATLMVRRSFSSRSFHL